MEPTLSKKICTFVWNLLSILIFPIALIRLANHYIIRPYILKTFILHTLKHQNYIEKDSVQICTLKNEKITGEFLKIPSPNGGNFTAVYTKGNLHPEKLVIACGGQGAFAEDTILQIEGIAKGFSILSINPMGVDGSSGFPSRNGLNLEESFALPVYSAFEFAEKTLKIKPGNITLYGFSLGGLSSALGAVHIQKKYGSESIKIISDRSLISMTNFAISFSNFIIKTIKEKTRTFSYSQIKLRGKIVKFIISILPIVLVNVIIRCAMKIFGLEADAETAWLKLQTKNKCIIYCKNDEIMLFEEGATLFQGVQKKSSFNEIELGQHYKHCTDYQEPELNIVHNQLCNFLNSKNEKNLET